MKTAGTWVLIALCGIAQSLAFVGLLAVFVWMGR